MSGRAGGAFQLSHSAWLGAGGWLSAIARIAGTVSGIATGAIVASRVTGVSRPSLAPLLPVGLVCAMGVTVPLIFARQVYGDSSTYAVTTATLLGVTVLSGATGVVLLRRLNR